MITILAIGKKHEDWVQQGIAQYEKRLKRPYDISWQLLPHSYLEEHRARDEESTRLLERIQRDARVVLLDETGDGIDNAALVSYLDTQFTNSRGVTIIIGGAYGVDDRIRAQADEVWALSDLVFPHQLVRLILVEQIYRSQEIAKGGRYHHV